VERDPVVWIPQNNGFPNVRVDMLDIRPDNNKVVAGTHGRTMFTTTWDVSGVVANTDRIKFEIYPNPATEILNISVPDKNLKVEILNLNGKIVKEQILRNKKEQIDISNLPKGYYLLKIKNTIKKLLIQ